MPIPSFQLTPAATSIKPTNPALAYTPGWGGAIASLRGGARPGRAAPGGLYPTIPDNPGLFSAGLDATDPLADNGGARLPLGAPVSAGPGGKFSGFDSPTNVPGLYNSVHTPGTPAQVGNGPAPAPSKYTMTSVPPNAAAGAVAGDPGAAAPSLGGAFGRSAEALALSNLFSPEAATATSAGSKSQALAASDAFAGLGSTGNLLRGAEGLEHTKLMSAAANLSKGPNAYSATGQLLDAGSRAPAGTVDLAAQMPKPYDPPEVRASKLEYLTKRFGSAIVNDPTLAANGKAPSTEDLATLAQSITRNAGQPRYVDLGKDSAGRPVEGTVDRSGNFSRIAAAKADFPRAIDAGGRKLIEVANGKFTDEKGTPVEWRGAEHPLTVNEFLMSPTLSQKYEGDYGSYRKDFTTQTGKIKPDGPMAAAAPGGAPAGAAAPGAPAPVVNYNHNDVLAELKKRGLAGQPQAKN